MRMLDLILAKKAGRAHTEAELAFLVGGVTDGSIPAYQLSAWLMAVCFQGMDDRETGDLTLAMLHSGETVDLSGVGAPCVDKHSTGGVGDTTTLILTPLVAACGAPVAKMSGRGLGFTGGTVDKLESIAGFQTERTTAELIAQVRSVGCAVVGQSGDLAPADKALYALRDVTGTVESLPLIASSVMSKKLASGASGIVLDVKTGSGALMHTLEGSIELARVMVDIGSRAGRRIQALVTDMDQPLGTHVGNALEVREAIDVLQGRAQGPLLEVSLLLAERMLDLAGVEDDRHKARALLCSALEKGAAARKFEEMILAQGGDPRVVQEPERLPGAARQVPVPARGEGIVSSMDTAQIGEVAKLLGAGRSRHGDPVDPAVGLVLHKRVGERVAAGEALMTLHVNQADHLQEALERAEAAVCIGNRPVSPLPLVYATVGEDGIERYA